jgi:hypothetical protein
MRRPPFAASWRYLSTRWTEFSRKWASAWSAVATGKARSQWKRAVRSARHRAPTTGAAILRPRSTFAPALARSQPDWPLTEREHVGVGLQGRPEIEGASSVGKQLAYLTYT